MLQSGFWRCDFGTGSGQIRYKLTFRLVIFLKTFLYNVQQFVSELKGLLNFAIASGQPKNSWERAAKTVLPSGGSHKTIFLLKTYVCNLQ